MGIVLPFPAPEITEQTILLKNLPDDISIFLITGYTDLRRSIAGLCRIVEEFDMDSRSRCITMFCGRRADRFKMLFYDGDGYLLMSKWFSRRRIHWPRIGGKKENEMWWLSHEQFESILSGNSIEDDEGNYEEEVDAPDINRERLTMYMHMLGLKERPKSMYVFTGYTDLRKSVGGYCGIVSQYGLNPAESALFAFCGKRADRIKVLFYDGDGYMLMVKQLTNGRFIWPRDKDESWKVLPSQLFDILAGRKLDRDKVLSVINANALR